LLHARLVVAHEAHARITAIRTEAALEAPGVVGVLTAADLPIVATGLGRQYEPLAREEVVYVGQPVAIVIAEGEALAADGAELVEVDLETLRPVLDLESAARPGSPRVRVHERSAGEGSDISDAHASVAVAGVGEDEELSENVLDTARLEQGDVDGALAASHVVVRGRFMTPWMYQGYIEPQTATAWLEPDGELVISSSTQAPFATRDGVAELFGMPSDRVRVRTAPIGGAFGGKIMIVEPLVVSAVLALRRPVRLALTRSEDIGATNPAGAEVLELELGADAEGRFTGIRSRVLVDRGNHRRLRPRVDRRPAGQRPIPLGRPPSDRARGSHEPRDVRRVPGAGGSACRVRRRVADRRARRAARDRPAGAAAAQRRRRGRPQSRGQAVPGVRGPRVPRARPGSPAVGTPRRAARRRGDRRRCGLVAGRLRAGRRRVPA